MKKVLTVIFEISDLLRHFLVEFGMQLFLYNLSTLIRNLPMPSTILYFSYSKYKNKMATKISENVTTLHHGLAHNENKKHYFGVTNNIFGLREFSYYVSEGYISTIVKQWRLNLITRIIITHEVVSPNFWSDLVQGRFRQIVQ